MKAYILINPGLEELAIQELSELIKVKAKKVGSGILELETTKENLILLVHHSQSFRKILITVDKKKDFKKFNLNKVNFEDYFSNDSSFKVEVEGVKGQENRTEISKNISEKIFSLNKNKKLEVKYKEPNAFFLVYFDRKSYFLGIDLVGFELNKRHYRLFPHQSSFRGDLAYYLVRKSSFKSGEKLVVGFVKDGTLAIEAALFNFNKIITKENFAYEKLLLFKETKICLEKTTLRPSLKTAKKKTKIIGFDESMMNLIAARKNAQIAGIKELIELNKFDLDELDVKFSKGEIDRLIFHITRKDENKINDIYYQADYVLKKKGVLLLVGRTSWEVSVSNKFKLVSEEILKRGGSEWKVLVMEKK